MNLTIGKAVMTKKLFLILIFVLIHCAYETAQRTTLDSKEIGSRKVLIQSEDKILTHILCDSVLKSGEGQCISEPSLLDKDSILISVSAKIGDSSSDYFINVGKSIATLTLGVFLSNSATVHFNVKNLNQESEPLKIKSEGRIGRWAILPFYAGLAATSFGGILNTYRNPDHLQKYCLTEVVSRTRKILEASKEEYCADYLSYLQDSFNKVEINFIETIRFIGKNQ
ncbi:MAG TPA: hypothetical protein PK079_01340 [Leptospiraceae bacterium]|nr:hypothetical protein [Leptospiraceae bacterium]HNE51782.1 hypothetical protein [Leptospiraceae bacterium]